MDEMNRNEHHIFFIFAFPNHFFGMAMENVVFTLCFIVFYVFLWNGLINRTSIFIAEELDVCPCWNRKILHLPFMAKDVWNMLTIRNLQRSNIFQPSNIFQDSTLSNALHITLLHPPTPPPPFCKQQRNLQHSNIFQPSNIFQDSTSSNALHITLLHPPTPPPPLL